MQCLVEVGKLLPVRKVIGGNIGKVGNTFEIVLRLVDVETGEVEAGARARLRGETDQLLDLIDKATWDLCLDYARKRGAK